MKKDFAIGVTIVGPITITRPPYEPFARAVEKALIGINEKDVLDFDEEIALAYKAGATISAYGGKLRIEPQCKFAKIEGTWRVELPEEFSKQKGQAQ